VNGGGIEDGRDCKDGGTAEAAEVARTAVARIVVVMQIAALARTAKGRTKRQYMT